MREFHRRVAKLDPPEKKETRVVVHLLSDEKEAFEKNCRVRGSMSGLAHYLLSLPNKSPATQRFRSWAVSGRNEKLIVTCSNAEKSLWLAIAREEGHNDVSTLIRSRLYAYIGVD